MKQTVIFSALLSAITSFAYAENVTQLDEVVVTATRVEQPIKRSLAHTTVITQQDIQDSQAVDVPALIKGLAGVEIYQSGGVGKQTSLFVRGTNSSHTLVLLDGVRINSATTGATAIEQLMLDQIERIEVVRGNVSSLYGSEAIGGVIQIFTKRGKGEPAISVSGGAGSLGTQKVSSGFGGESGNTTFNVQVARFKTDGVSAIKPSIVATVNPDVDGYQNTSVSANLQQAFNEDHSIAASLFDSDASNQTDNAYGLITDINQSKLHIQKIGVVSDNRLSKNWFSKLQLSQGVDDLQNFKNNLPDVTLGAQFKTTSDLFSWQGTAKVSEDDVLLVGIEKLSQKVASSTLYTRTNRTDNSVFVGYTGNYGSQQLQLNLRQDNYSDFGTANTWLAGYGVEINKAWRATAKAATAFKAPTLNDLFYPFVDYGYGYSYVGNSNLKPERSRNYELGLHYAVEEQRFDLVYFDNLITDLIVSDNLSAGSMINLDETRSDGAELSYGRQLGDTSLKFASTWQNPRNEKTGQLLLRRAQFFATAEVTHKISSWKLGGEWQHSGERDDFIIKSTSRTQLPSYDVINLTASYAVDKRLALKLRVDNLFSQDYMLAHGYSTLGRVLFVGVTYQ